MIGTTWTPGNTHLPATVVRTLLGTRRLAVRSAIAFCAIVRSASGLSLAVVTFAAISGLSHAQAPELDVTLPNPDGRDPTFDQSNAGRPIVIEFLDLATSTRLSLDDSAGPLRLINFWATWCTPCIRELPSLAGLAGSYSTGDFQVLPISLDQKGAPNVPAFVSELGVHGLTWYVDPTATSGQAADVFVLPTSVIVDAGGNEVGRIVGSADWQSTAAAELINTLLRNHVKQD